METSPLICPANCRLGFKYAIFIRSNLRVAQNGRFVIKLVYPGGRTTVAKIVDFGLSENLKMHPPTAFALPNYI